MKKFYNNACLNLILLGCLVGMFAGWAIGYSILPNIYRAKAVFSLAKIGYPSQKSVGLETIDDVIARVKSQNFYDQKLNKTCTKADGQEIDLNKLHIRKDGKSDFVVLEYIGGSKELVTDCTIGIINKIKKIEMEMAEPHVAELNREYSEIEKILKRERETFDMIESKLTRARTRDDIGNALLGLNLLELKRKNIENLERRWGDLKWALLYPNTKDLEMIAEPSVANGDWRVGGEKIIFVMFGALIGAVVGLGLFYNTKRKNEK